MVSFTPEKSVGMASVYPKIDQNLFYQTMIVDVYNPNSVCIIIRSVLCYVEENNQVLLCGLLSFPILVPEPVYMIASLKRVNLSHNQITEVSTLIG